MSEPAASGMASIGAAEQHRLHCQEREDEFTSRLAFLRRALATTSAAQDDDHAFPRLLTSVIDCVEQVHRRGYAIVPDLLDTACIERLRQGLGPLLATSSAHFAGLAAQGPTGAVHIQNALAKTRAADEIALHPMIRALVGGILGFDFIFHAGAIVTAHDAGCGEQPLHRDDASFYAFARPRMPLVITAAIGLDDFTSANGATHVVPGSCWWERERKPMSSEIIPVEMPAGSVLVWDGAMFHGGGANVTDRPRPTLLLNYTRGWLRTQYNQFLSVPRDVVLSLPAELQRDLGYGRSLRALGECDGLEPVQYLEAIQRDGDGVQWLLGPETRAPGPQVGPTSAPTGS